MPTALQGPVRTTSAESVGPKLFRKQVLKVGRLPYKGRVLEFDRPYLERLVRNFSAGAFDQVAFQLANKDNEHTLDPERTRGEVKALELNGDGLDAIVEVTEEGARVIRDNPRLGVSARIVEEPVDGAPAKVPAIQHVLGTLDPRVTGLTPWDAISDFSTSYAAGQIIDLTASRYEDEARMPTETAKPTLTDEQITELKSLEGDKFQEKLVELLAAASETGAKDGDRSGDKNEKDGEKRSIVDRLLGRKDEGKPADGEPSDEEVRAAVEKLIDEAEGNEGTGTEAEREGEKVAALSAEDRAAIDLARTEATEARKEAAEQRFLAERSKYVLKGVPPALVDLCKPALTAPEGTIDLSNGEKFDAAAFARSVLDKAVGLIDLSGPLGSSEDSDESKEAKAAAKAWQENPA